MPNLGKTSRVREKTQTQAKLTDVGAQSVEHEASKEANVSTETPEQYANELTGAKEEILVAINSLKSEFSTRLDGILTAFEETKKELANTSRGTCINCGGRTIANNSMYQVGCL